MCVSVASCLCTVCRLSLRQSNEKLEVPQLAPSVCLDLPPAADDSVFTRSPMDDDDDDDEEEEEDVGASIEVSRCSSGGLRHQPDESLEME